MIARLLSVLIALLFTASIALPQVILPLGPLGSNPPPTISFLSAPTFTSGTSSPSFSVNIGNPGRDRVIVVMPYAERTSTTVTISSVTVGGTSLSKQASGRHNSGGGTIDLWSGVVPAATNGTQTISVSYNTTMDRGGVMVYQIVDYLSASPASANNTDNISAAAGNVAVTASALGVVVAGYVAGNNYGSVTWTQPTENCDGPVIGGGQGGSCAIASGTSSGSYTATATLNASPSIGAAMVAAAFR